MLTWMLQGTGTLDVTVEYLIVTCNNVFLKYCTKMLKVNLFTIIIVYIIYYNIFTTIFLSNTLFVSVLNKILT